MPGPDPFEAIDQLRRSHPTVRTLLLSAYIRDGYLDAAYRVGAWGYLSKSDSPDAVIEGIRSVARGELAFSEAVRSRSQLDARGAAETGESRLSSLTPRELQILRMFAQGLSRMTIAEELSRSPMTIDNHRKSLMKKLGIHDRTELVRYAIAEGLVEP
ncbi:MAG: LuxR C-terminal-related transcriptional regulator [Planctomycetota bacterium]|jgi:DNA-binding NarL/FixJ family response regulator